MVAVASGVRWHNRKVVIRRGNVLSLSHKKPRRSGVFFYMAERCLERQRFAVQFQFAVVVFQFGDVVFAFNGNEHRALAFDE